MTDKLRRPAGLSVAFLLVVARISLRADPPCGDGQMPSQNITCTPPDGATGSNCETTYNKDFCDNSVKWEPTPGVFGCWTAPKTEGNTCVPSLKLYCDPAAGNILIPVMGNCGWKTPCKWDATTSPPKCTSGERTQVPKQQKMNGCLELTCESMGGGPN